MNIPRSRRYITLIALSALALYLGPPHLFAHCDGLDGPVVKAAQRALAEADLNFALIWVHKDDEPEVRRVFEKALSVRKLGAEAKELADLYFFETLVRVHRAREGAAYTGLKPAGRDLGPAISAGDKALETGDIDPVLHLLSSEMKHGLHERFKEVLAKRKFAKENLEAGRAYVKAYVAYIHYVDGVHKVASATTAHHLGEVLEHARQANHPEGP